MTETPSTRLKMAMDRAGVSAAELGRRTGIQAGTIRAAANGYADVRPAKATKYARHLGIDAEWILYGRGKGPDGKIAAMAEPAPAGAVALKQLERIPATERAHVLGFIEALAKRVPEVVTFIQADIEAAAEERLMKVKFAASERAGMIMTIAKRAEVAARKTQPEKKAAALKPLKGKA